MSSHLGRGIDMGEIGRDLWRSKGVERGKRWMDGWAKKRWAYTGGSDDIVQRELGHKGVDLQEEGQGLSDSTCREEMRWQDEMRCAMCDPFR